MFIVTEYAALRCIRHLYLNVKNNERKNNILIQNLTISIARLTTHLLHRLHRLGSTFCFLFLRAKFRNWAILFIDKLIELLDIDIVCKKRDILLDSFIFCTEEKRLFFNLNTDSRISFFGSLKYSIARCFYRI